MPVVVVANPKGGVGKSTLATQVAGYFASRGHAVMLGDADRQQSSHLWLSLRPPQVAPIQSWALDDDQMAKPPKGTTHVVLDTPAGLGGARLDAALNMADKLLIPLQASLFDIQATHAFLQMLRAHPRAGRVAMGLVGMRVREHTHALEHLHEFIATLRLPLLASLRDTQNYVHLAARGLTLWDVAPGRVARDLEQWQALTDWLNT